MRSLPNAGYGPGRVSRPGARACESVAAQKLFPNDFRFFLRCNALLEGAVFNSEVYRAMTKQGEDTPPPDPGDLEGWRKAVACGRVAQFSPEALVAALQDLGPGLDAAIRDPIARQLNRMLMAWLRGHVGHNHVGGGEDIILRIQFTIFEALLDKNSADGKALRVAFWARASFRAKDAIAKEYRDSRIPLTHEPKKKGTANDDEVPLDEEKAAEVRQLVGSSERDEETEDVGGFVGDDAVSSTARPTAAVLEGLIHFEESHGRRAGPRSHQGSGLAEAPGIPAAHGESVCWVDEGILHRQGSRAQLEDCRKMDQGDSGHP